jgi:hypothetical protein
VVRFGCLPTSLGKQANYLYFSDREVIGHLELTFVNPCWKRKRKEYMMENVAK